MNQMEVKRRQIQYVSYLMGAVLWLFFGRLIGDNGLAYLAAATECVGFFLLLASGTVPDGLGRLVRSRRGKGQYKSAEKLRRHTWRVQIPLGLFCTLLCAVSGGILLEKVLRMPYGSFAVRLMAPVILLRTVNSLMLGGFQGNGSQMPAAFCALLRQILFLLFGILFCRLLASYGEKVGNLLANEDFQGMYGVVGLALAMAVTELLLLICLGVLYLGSDRKGEGRRSEGGLRRTESFSENIRALYRISSFGMGLYILVKLPVWAGLAIYQRSVPDIYASAHLYGAYYGVYLVVCGILVLSAGICYLNLYGRMTAASKKGDRHTLRELGAAGVHHAWLYGLYTGVALAVLAPQAAGGLFAGSDPGLEGMLRAGSALVLFVCLAAVLLMQLAAQGERIPVLGALAAADVIFCISCRLLCGGEGGTPLDLVLSGLIASGVLAAGCMAYSILRGNLRLEYVRVLAIPLVAAGIVGLILMLTARLLTPHLGASFSFWLNALLGLVLYLGILMAARNVTEQEVNVWNGPLGRRIWGILVR